MPHRPLLRLLWADADQHRALCMVHPLKNLGFQLRPLYDGWSALREARADPGRYDAAVVDIELPGLEAEELTRLLRRAQPDLPLVFLGTPRWGLGPGEIALALPVSPVALHDALSVLAARPTATVGPDEARPIRLAS